MISNKIQRFSEEDLACPPFWIETLTSPSSCLSFPLSFSLFHLSPIHDDLWKGALLLVDWRNRGAEMFPWQPVRDTSVKEGKGTARCGSPAGRARDYFSFETLKCNYWWKGASFWKNNKKEYISETEKNVKVAVKKRKKKKKKNPKEEEEREEEERKERRWRRRRNLIKNRFNRFVLVG